MKKALKIVTLILAVCMTATFMFGCAMFGAIDPKDAKKNLKDAGYEVMLIDDEEDIEMMGKEFDGAEAVISAFDRDEYVYAVLFEEKADAKDFFEDRKEEFEDEIKDLEDAIEEAYDNDEDDYAKDLEDELEEMKENQIKRLGKWVVMASSKDALNAFKKGK